MTRIAATTLSLAVLSALPSCLAADGAQSQPSAVPAARQDVSLLSVHGLYATSIVATGRVQSLVSARIGPRVSGRLAALGTAENGQALDAGVPVKAGQVLFELDKTTFQNHLILSAAQLESAKAALHQVTAPARQERIDQIKQELVQLEVQLADKVRERDRYKKLVEVEKTLPPRPSGRERSISGLTDGSEAFRPGAPDRSSSWRLASRCGCRPGAGKRSGSGRRGRRH